MLLIHIQPDRIRCIDQIHKSSIIRPVDKIKLAALAVERVKRDVQLARGDEFPARDPLHRSVVVDAGPEALVGLVVVDRLRTETSVTTGLTN